MLKNSKLIILSILVFAFFMKWYSDFGGDVSGFSVPWFEGKIFLFILYLSPFFAIRGILKILKGKDPHLDYPFAAIPILYFLFFMHYPDGVIMIATYSYFWGWVTFILCVIMVIQSISILKIFVKDKKASVQKAYKKL
ncbi:hypothetical protein P4679_22615 [Priestia megaterium]|uniref:hypothetical protein n=1 Tax=Priestia megaterium TaxID=1404 RepID=UPI002E24770E|nr:hypothetical protein [Priestia megaterium]